MDNANCLTVGGLKKSLEEFSGLVAPFDATQALQCGAQKLSVRLTAIIVANNDEVQIPIIMTGLPGHVSGLNLSAQEILGARAFALAICGSLGDVVVTDACKTAALTGLNRSGASSEMLANWAILGQLEPVAAGIKWLGARRGMLRLPARPNFLSIVREKGQGAQA